MHLSLSTVLSPAATAPPASSSPQQRPSTPTTAQAVTPNGSPALPPALAAYAAATAFGQAGALSRTDVRSQSALSPTDAMRQSADFTASSVQTSRRPPVSRSKGFEEFNGRLAGDVGHRGHRESPLGALYSIDELAGGSSLATQEFLVHKGTVGAGAWSPCRIAAAVLLLRLIRQMVCNPLTTQESAASVAWESSLQFAAVLLGTPGFARTQLNNRIPLCK